MLRMQENSKNIFWHNHSVTVEDRWKYNGHKSCVLWFTGLSAAGKSTIANSLCKRLLTRNIKSYVLDGDNVRHGLNKDLGFSPEDRTENIRRVGEVAKLFVDAGVIVLTAFISPYKEDRERVRRLMDKEHFVEVYVKCPAFVCETRDPKGIYTKARAGQIKEFTSISSPYEEPEQPDIVLETDNMSVDECVEKMLKYLNKKNYVNMQISDQASINRVSP
jgi:adenylylsulfate kinase